MTEKMSSRREPGDTALTFIRGRAAGSSSDGQAPKFVGRVTLQGLVQVVCFNYPEHWQEIQLSLESQGGIDSIRGRPAGKPDQTGGSPKFVGSLSPDGLIRIDCLNYPEHWQEIQLPDEVMHSLAYK